MGGPVGRASRSRLRVFFGLTFVKGRRLVFREALRMYRYYKPPTLSLRPTSRIRGLNLKVPSPHPRGREFLRPLGKKTQPTATPSTGGKKAIYGRNAQKYQKCSVGKCPSGARRNRKHRWLKSQLYRFKCLVACRSLKPRGTARNGRKRPCSACF